MVLDPAVCNRRLSPRWFEPNTATEKERYCIRKNTIDKIECRIRTATVCQTCRLSLFSVGTHLRYTILMGERAGKSVSWASIAGVIRSSRDIRGWTEHRQRPRACTRQAHGFCSADEVLPGRHSGRGPRHVRSGLWRDAGSLPKVRDSRQPTPAWRMSSKSIRLRAMVATQTVVRACDLLTSLHHLRPAHSRHRARYQERTAVCSRDGRADSVIVMPGLLSTMATHACAADRVSAPPPRSPNAGAGSRPQRTSQTLS